MADSYYVECSSGEVHALFNRVHQELVRRGHNLDTSTFLRFTNEIAGWLQGGMYSSDRPEDIANIVDGIEKELSHGA